MPGGVVVMGKSTAGGAPALCDRPHAQRQTSSPGRQKNTKAWGWGDGARHQGRALAKIIPKGGFEARGDIGVKQELRGTNKKKN
eukprot:scaffold12345_cov56-Isochrysis_galbana.AAC.1